MSATHNQPANTKVVDEFKRSTAGCLRTLAQDAELQLAFGDDDTEVNAMRLSLRVPPNGSLSSAERTRLRGLSDSLALLKAHHDPDLHAQLAPGNALWRRFFDALERERFEALGSNAYAGIAYNLSRLWRQRYSPDTLSRLNAVEQFEYVLIQACRTALLKLPVSNDAALLAQAQGVDVQQLVHNELQQLAAHMHDQAGYAECALRLLERLSLDTSLTSTHGVLADVAGLVTPSPNDDGAQTGEDDEDAAESVDEDERDSDALTQQGQAESGDVDEVANDVIDAAPMVNLDNVFDVSTSSSVYRAYTTAFDETVHAATLSSPAQLRSLRILLDQHIDSHGQLIARLATRLQRTLLARQKRQWAFDQDEGQLDSSRLTRVVTQPSFPLLFKTESDMAFRDTSITLLIDNSRSMLGRPIRMAAACADILARTLERCGVSVEVLGFTTVALDGGRSTEQWRRQGAPANPGRLNDVRHIIYKSADTPWRSARHNLGLMLSKDLLNQNIDGEALSWAYTRLRRRSEQRKILIMISDGAPVDTSTLAANSSDYLSKHLHDVIHVIEEQSIAELLAIGIGHDVSQYYAHAVNLFDARRLGPTLLSELSVLLQQSHTPVN